MTTKQWRGVIKFLKSHFPLTSKVRVIRRPMVKYSGRLLGDANTFRLYINSNDSDSAQIDSLMHEWAHAAAYELVSKHGGCWGDIFGTINQTWEDKFK